MPRFLTPRSPVPPAQYGIYIDGAVCVTVLNSSVVSNDGFGIAIADSAQATIVACTIAATGPRA